ncbi:GntR family transcriptional regulator [Roseibacterium sp. SDUM158016]|uniref:GntR family transcriptional regulator n=1 Tax=Roseicyclus sediminis TaxID=2980997 RepID=UPI0021CE7DFC|nr:GntR family transcriptional regulator [Roseibacterium sp. SDUM158016]MCU4652032.1 GntR family transcriptional regulator [Roseibacterium sp. SDUM158016]
MDSASDSNEANTGARALFAVERPQMLLRDQVLAKLREAIITGVYRPGERLLERELCEMLDVSRTSVREALRQLEIEELVSVGPRGRPFVTEISAEAAREIYEFRVVLEKSAVAMFIARAPQTAFAELERLSGAFADALDRGDVKARLQLKSAFYETLFGHAGNPPMQTVFTRLFNRIGFLRARSLRRIDNAALRSAELQEIVDRILARDVAGAQASIERHVRSVGDLAVDYLETASREARDG